MRLLIPAFLALSFLLLFSRLTANKNLPASNSVATPSKGIEHKKILTRFKVISTDMEAYAKKNNYNSGYCFLIDMKLPSGNNRFFVYDIKKDSILDAGLVAHGSGSDNGNKDLIFSNTINSNCTSLGKYKIGNSYSGKFGLAYKLHGLDKTNSNAFNRFVVLHSHSCVPEVEVAPEEICRSWGCPTVAPGFLGRLKKYIDESDKPILLQIFY